MSATKFTWYLAKRYCNEGGTDVTVTADKVIFGDTIERSEFPGTGNPVVPYVKPGMRMYAYDSITDSVLVGFQSGYDCPAKDWKKLSLNEAKEHFFNYYKRQPLEAEVN